MADEWVDPFGREPERTTSRFAGLALSVGRLTLPVAATWALVGPAGLPFHLAPLGAGVAFAALEWMRRRSVRSGHGPAADSPLRRAALKRALMIAIGVLYGGLVYVALSGAGDDAAVAAAAAAFLVSTEEARERLGLPAPEDDEEDEPVIWPPSSDATSLDFHRTDHADWERLGPPRAG